MEVRIDTVDGIISDEFSERMKEYFSKYFKVLNELSTFGREAVENYNSRGYMIDDIKSVYVVTVSITDRQLNLRQRVFVRSPHSSVQRTVNNCNFSLVDSDYSREQNEEGLRLIESYNARSGVVSVVPEDTEIIKQRRKVVSVGEGLAFAQKFGLPLQVERYSALLIHSECKLRCLEAGDTLIEGDDVEGQKVVLKLFGRLIPVDYLKIIVSRADDFVKYEVWTDDEADCYRLIGVCKEASNCFVELGAW